MTPHSTTQGVYHRLVLWNIASGRSAAGELRDAGADLVLDDLADTEAVLAAVDRLTAPIRS